MKSTLELVQRQHTFPALYRHKKHSSLVVLFNSERTGTVLYDARWPGKTLPMGYYDGWVDKATDSLHWERLSPGDKVTLENTEDTGFPALYKGDQGQVVLFTSEKVGTLIVPAPNFPPPGFHNKDWYPYNGCIDVWERLPVGERIELINERTKGTP